MLARALPAHGGLRVQLVVMPGKDGSKKVLRYHRAACLPILPNFTKSGESRLVSFFECREAIKSLIQRAKRGCGSVVLFVRNHPLLLLVAASLRSHVDRLIYQNSFPLENSHRKAWKRAVHRNALKVGCRTVDAVLAVSPLGLDRTKKLCRPQTPGAVIPLLSDFPKAECADHSLWPNDDENVRFIYVGSHALDRKLEIILEAAVISLQAGENGCFAFVGGQPHETGRLVENLDVRHWVEVGRIIFRPAVERNLIPGLLASAHCGLSLIPDHPLFKEASPTKTAEYLGAGLCVLGSYGPELQEEFIRDSDAGLLVKFEPQEIAAAIGEVITSPRQRQVWSESALMFSRHRLDYQLYAKPFMELAGC